MILKNKQARFASKIFKKAAKAGIPDGVSICVSFGTQAIASMYEHDGVVVQASLDVVERYHNLDAFLYSYGMATIATE